VRPPATDQPGARHSDSSRGREHASQPGRGAAAGRRRSAADPPISVAEFARSPGARSGTLLGELSIVELKTVDAVVFQIAYAIVNPVAAGLVWKPEDWPGLCVRVDRMCGGAGELNGTRDLLRALPSSGATSSAYPPERSPRQPVAEPRSTRSEGGRWTRKRASNRQRGARSTRQAAPATTTGGAATTRDGSDTRSWTGSRCSRAGGLRLRDALRLIVIRENSINPATSSYDDMTKSVPPPSTASEHSDATRARSHRASARAGTRARPAGGPRGRSSSFVELARQSLTNE